MNESPQREGERRERTAGMIPGRRVLLSMSAALAVLATAFLGVALARQDPAPPQAAKAPAETGASSTPPAARGGRPSGPAVPDPSGHEGHESHKGHQGHQESSSTAKGKVLERSEPQRVTVSSLGVQSPLEDLGLDANRAMETPADTDKAGWYSPGPTPGELGPAVIAGHVTWDGEPSVFFKLGAVKKGATIEVDREDGKTAVFTVERTARYPKDEFPTVEVYRNLDHAGLRLITCGGDYSEATRRYSDNVVVYASLTSVR